VRKTYRGFILDADNTLFDFDRGEREALADTLSRLLPGGGYPQESFESYHRINAELWKAFERGAVRLEELRIVRFRELFAQLGLKADPRQASELYIEALAGKAFLLPHAREVLENLHRRAALALLSNGLSRVQRGRLAGSGIGDLFQRIIISEEVRLAKPDPGIFLLALSELGLPGREVLCVGDSPATDIRGAHLAGLATCWVQSPGSLYPPEEPPPDYRISDLRELLDFVADGELPA
jgi:2-haloacid dehalogenase